MSDLFHPKVPEEFIARVFDVMGRAPQHTFQVLTKRPGRMASILEVLPRLIPDTVSETGWPLANVWLGTSVENQRWANIRIPSLIRSPAAIRFLSCEPLLGPIDLGSAVAPVGSSEAPKYAGFPIEWVIVGGESGPGARSIEPEWAQSLRDQCVAIGVPFFFKQWGGRTPRARGRLLDGRLDQHRRRQQERFRGAEDALESGRPFGAFLGGEFSCPRRSSGVRVDPAKRLGIRISGATGLETELG